MAEKGAGGMFSPGTDVKIQHEFDKYVSAYLRASDPIEKRLTLVEISHNDVIATAYDNKVLSMYIQVSIQNNKESEKLSFDEKFKLVVMIFNETEAVVMKRKKEIEEMTAVCKELIKSYFKNKNNPQAWQATLSNICQQDIIKTRGQSIMFIIQLRENLKKSTTLSEKDIIHTAATLAEEVKMALYPPMETRPTMRR